MRFTTHVPTCLATNIKGRKVFFSWVVKRATLLFNSFCSKVAKQVARFLLPVLPVTQVVHVVNITLFLLYRTLEQSEGEYDSVQ